MSAKGALPEGTRISFALPSSPTGEYAIMHLHRVGEKQVWIAERPSSTGRERGVVTTTVISLGTYALVQLSAPAERAGSSVAASKQE